MNMKGRNLAIYLLTLWLGNLNAEAQDPHYTQFFAAPFTVNPAYTGVFNGQARFTSNYRQQWGNAIDPYVTATAAFDAKIGSAEPDRQHPFNMGVQFMNDRSMKGTFRSNYISATASYHVALDEQGRANLGAGLMGTYGNRRIDFSALSFDEQFSSGGFDRSLPTGESALQQMKPFVSIGAGLLFGFNDPDNGTFFDLGVSGFHFNKPEQTVLKDKNQFLPVRYSVQANLQRFVGEKGLLNIRTIYQSQAAVEYFSAGLSIGSMFGDSQENTVGAGLWYRSSDAVSPYVFMDYNRMMIGLSYDVVVSNLNKAPKPIRSIELSLQWRMGGN